MVARVLPFPSSSLSKTHNLICMYLKKVSAGVCGAPGEKWCTTHHQIYWLSCEVYLYTNDIYTHNKTFLYLFRPTSTISASISDKLHHWES